jgi:thiamine-phosphate pyrophosphorylase
MSSQSVIRIIDANLNRLAEGLRVLEEAARMVLNDVELTQQLKTLRHDLVRNDLSFNMELVRSRDSAGDVGAALEITGEEKQKELPLLILANSRRAQESLRVLEDMAKLPDIALKLDSETYKKARFELYTLEQQLLSNLMRFGKVKKVSGLYVIIDTQALQGKSHVDIARRIIQADVKVIQLRDKTTPKKQLLPVAKALQELCRENEVLFIVNDYLDVALAIDADGLHVGQDDLPVEVARQLLPADKILGCSAATVEEARSAEIAGADYIGVGCVYPTSSKENIELVGVEIVGQIKSAVKIPVAAIGGINLENVGEVIRAKADSVCVISAVLNAPDVTKAALDMIKLIEANR